MKQHCDVCKVWLNSEDQYMIHVLGKSHKKKNDDAVKAFPKQREQTEGSASGQILDFVRKTFMIGFVPQSQSQDKSAVVSSASDVHGHSDSQIQIPAEFSTISSIDGPSNPKKKKEVEEYFCTICVTKMTSKEQADAHYEGKKHKKALARLTGQDGNEMIMAGSWCEVCKVPLTSKAIADTHYAGSKHEKRLRLTQMTGMLAQQSEVSSTTQTFSLPSQVQHSSQSSIPAPQNVEGHLSEQSQLTGFTSFSLQPVTPQPTTESTTTPSVYQESGQMQSTSISNERKRKIQAGSMLFCSFCNISVNSQAQMDAHRQGGKHKNKVLASTPQQRTKEFTPKPPPYAGGMDAYMSNITSTDPLTVDNTPQACSNINTWYS